jgi:hypothetical protein
MRCPIEETELSAAKNGMEKKRLFEEGQLL